MEIKLHQLTQLVLAVPLATAFGYTAGHFDAAKSAAERYMQSCTVPQGAFLVHSTQQPELLTCYFARNPFGAPSFKQEIKIRPK